MSRIKHLLRRINETSIDQLFQSMSDKDFALISGFRGANPLDVNLAQNVKLAAKLKAEGMDITPLKGGWSEPQPDGSFKMTTEDSFFVPRPDDMTELEFTNKIMELVNEFEQDAAIVSTDGKVNTRWANGKVEHLGDYPEITLKDIEGGFSEYLGHRFVFKKNQ